MALRVYNTMTRSKEDFVPLRGNRVGMYVCGPTVYGHSHLGHAKSYVSFDVILRYLRFLGYDVLYVQNITDVGHLLGDANDGEDRLVRQSKLEQRHPMQVAETYTMSYFEDMDRLGVIRPDISPRATGHITEQIDMIRQLLARGFAYEAGGSVYFDVQKFPGYGKLSGRSLEELEAGARVEIKAEKRNPADFALWKRAEPEHIMRWPSPWGEGFPGWHIECSAMSIKYLGSSFDIHGGGLENQFPHHECEIAQSEGVSDATFVRYWLHNNMVTVNGQKMGKSLGNFTTLKDAFKKWEPQVIRFFILQSHYRSTLDFSDAAVDAAAKGLERLRNTVQGVRERMRTSIDQGTNTDFDVERYEREIRSAMDDDFNTPQAIGILFDACKEINSLFSSSSGVGTAALKNVDELFVKFAGNVLGISLGVPSVAANGQLQDGLVDLLLAVRAEVRDQKLWGLSDRIRDGLTKLGIHVEDTREGTKWKLR